MARKKKQDLTLKVNEIEKELSINDYVAYLEIRNGNNELLVKSMMSCEKAIKEIEKVRNSIRDIDLDNLGDYPRVEITLRKGE